MTPILCNHYEKVQEASINLIGHIGEYQIVLSVLLTNLPVQEHQSHVCSTIAVAIIAETCGPFTCIPAILNEYRTVGLNTLVLLWMRSHTRMHLTPRLFPALPHQKAPSLCQKKETNLLPSSLHTLLVS